MEGKLCNKCGLIKSFKELVKNNAVKDGYAPVCKVCKENQRKARVERDKEILRVRYLTWYEQNKKKESLRKKKFRLENKDTLLKRERETIKTPEQQINRKIYTKKYRSVNKEKINKYSKDRRLKDPLFKITCNIRTLILNSFRNKGLKKNSKTSLILGCSFEEFKQHLEAKFEPWMNWINQGLYNGELNYGWDIDHIIPLATAKTEEAVIKLNHYTNLQPLCSKINRDIKIFKMVL